MNRQYTTNEYENIVNELRKNLENVSITTDIIVGFPGETRDEFNSTYNFLKKIKLSKMHIFKFSPRKGTKAEQMENQVDGNIKEERSNKLIELNKENEIEFIKGFINKEMDVLYEKMLKNNEGFFEGYTSNYIKVILSSNTNIEGKILGTLITGCQRSIEENFVYATGRIIEKIN
jgi:threonylcarbamoyladenosine tRNA methylthiotransferase MtaB